MTRKELLKQGKETLLQKQIEDASTIARLLLQFVLKSNRIELVKNDTKEVKKEEKEQYEQLMEEILKGKPLQYLTKHQEFYGLNFYVDSNVLIPQPDTEILVEEVVHIAKQEKKKEILDIGTGSGCIGISLAHSIEEVSIMMSDISNKALEVAKKNSKSNHVAEKITFVQSDLFEKIENTFDIIVSNPPYIETNVIPTLSKQVQQEPYIALNGGEDGLTFYRKLLQEAPKYLNKNGYLCMEIGYNQKEKILQLAQKIGIYKKVEIKQDLAGNNRVFIGKI